MQEDMIKQLVDKFWNAIICARNNGQFLWDERFNSFPVACCRDASDLLARFLYDNGYDTLSIYGECRDGSHRWLVWDDGQIRSPETWFFDDVVPTEVRQYYSSYGLDMSQHEEPYYSYAEQDIQNCLIIDITADQFGDPPVYCDYWSQIRKKYKYIKADKYEDLRTYRLQKLYDTIMDVIENQD